MLDVCAPGHTVKATVHHYCIRFNDKEFPNLPLGAHGASRSKLRAEVKVGDVRKMARYFGILDCAKKEIERLNH